jgi:hypothetical protein
MTAELTVLDMGGVHNKDVNASARIIRGASWKKQRVVVILPAGQSIATKVALSHWNLAFPPNNGVVRILAQGMEVGEAYSNAIDAVLANAELAQWEYILTIEHDNTPPADGLLKLLESMEAHPEFACIGGLYWTKGEGGVAQVWGDPSDPVLNFRPQPPRVDALQECCGTGMGFNLFRLAMFKDPKLRRPWFKTLAGSGGCATQDLYFWMDARQHGYRCAIDTRVKVGHFDPATEICW